MRRVARFLLVIALVAAGVGGYLLVNRRAGPGAAEPPAGQAQITRPAFRDNEAGLESQTVPIPPTGDPVEHTLNALLATADEGEGKSAMPKGTRLLSVHVEKGVATVDLSEEFRAINRSGDTGESLAFNALRAALAQFPQIETMRVLVAGQPFEGEHSGPWDEVPVRDSKARAGSER